MWLMNFSTPLILRLLQFLVTVVVDGVEEGLGGNGVTDGGADEGAASVSSSLLMYFLTPLILRLLYLRVIPMPLHSLHSPLILPWSQQIWGEQILQFLFAMPWSQKTWGEQILQLLFLMPWSQQIWGEQILQLFFLMPWSQQTWGEQILQYLFAMPWSQKTWGEQILQFLFAMPWSQQTWGEQIVQCLFAMPWSQQTWGGQILQLCFRVLCMHLKPFPIFDGRHDSISGHSFSRIYLASNSDAAKPDAVVLLAKAETEARTEEETRESGKTTWQDFKCH
jgi:hypothetical protein